MGARCFPFETGGVGIWVVLVAKSLELLGNRLVCECGVLGHGVLGLV